VSVLYRRAVSVFQHGARASNFTPLFLSYCRLGGQKQAAENDELTHGDTPESVAKPDILKECAAPAKMRVRLASLNRQPKVFEISR
jgi:hypothetical protein